MPAASSFQSGDGSIGTQATFHQLATIGEATLPDDCAPCVTDIELYL